MTVGSEHARTSALRGENLLDGHQFGNELADRSLQGQDAPMKKLLPSIAFLIVAVRYWRKITERTFAGEDVVLGFAMALSIAYTFVSYSYIKENHWGQREGTYDPMTIDTIYVNKLHYTYSIIYNPILCLVKASFLWTLYKLRSPRVWLNRAIIATQFVNAGYMIGATVASICACVPIDKNFDETVPGTCYEPTSYVIASVCIVILTDIIVVMMPTWMIYDLHMTRARKIIIISFLSFGLAVIAIGFVRLEYLIRIFITGDPGSSKYTVEQTYSAIESNLAIIGACGPTIKWMLSSCFPFLEPTEKRSTGGWGAPSSSSKSRQHRKYADPMDGALVSMGREEYMYMSSKNNDTVELRDGAGWKEPHGSVGSDERNDDPHGIVKTVEWNVSGDQYQAGVPRAGRNRPGGAVRPTDVV
ncbi:hypothetical protein FQN54_000285 [Arachnomyces sp. PD_36]|nr:hypothetical protein FQN54_000285 [Arachnomyces sp. PD_36]